MRILVLCTGNSCRSQMAEVYIRHFSNNEISVFSAGVEAHGLNPMALAVLEEDGMPIGQLVSQTLTEYEDANFDWVFTVCDNTQALCPIFPNTSQTLHHSFPDPAKANGSEEQKLAVFRTVRDEIKEYCQQWVSKLIQNSIS